MSGEVANRGECDHSGSLTALMDEIPGVPIYCTAAAVMSIEGQYGTTRRTPAY